MREKIGGNASNSLDRSKSGNLSVQLQLNDDGSVDFLDSAGAELSPRLITAVKKQQGDMVRQWLESQAAEINGPVDALERIHLDTPSPDQSPTYTPAKFDEERPMEPTPVRLGILGRLFRGVRERKEARNKQSAQEHSAALEKWEFAKAQFDEKERQRKNHLEEGIYNDTEAMQIVLEDSLCSIEWPRETNISFEVSKAGHEVLLDVDLPEIEDMPTKVAAVPARGWKLNIRQVSETQARKTYMNHVHGVGFRLIGETLATLPTVESLTLSAYSQRPDKATGETTDEYLYSVRVRRSDWAEIKFANIKEVDLPTCLARFEIRRNMTAGGLFKPVEPFGVS